MFLEALQRMIFRLKHIVPADSVRPLQNFPNQGWRHPEIVLPQLAAGFFKYSGYMSK